MTALEYYHEQCRIGHYQKDPAQISAVQQLDELRLSLLCEQNKRSNLFSALRKPRLVKGLYLWGSVGVGKTFIMDCFYHSLPFRNKLRMHFHQFMNYVHLELKKHQGKKDPLKYIAQDLARKALVLCFDEFYVTDVADAMLLARLLQALFSQGVCLVATSNIEPDELYKNGLQRQHFLPAIALLKKQVQVFHLGSDLDYRLLNLKYAGVFFIPNDEVARDNMEKSFSFLAENQSVQYKAIHILGRDIPIKKQAGELIWFDFKVICGVPRSQLDYLELVQKYKTLFISDVPKIGPQAHDRISLFIKLIDVLYDAKSRLVLSAEVPMDEIYSEGRLHAEYTRAHSRLVEMQSENYFMKG